MHYVPPHDGVDIIMIGVADLHITNMMCTYSYRSVKEATILDPGRKHAVVHSQAEADVSKRHTLQSASHPGGLMSSVVLKYHLTLKCKEQYI